MTKNRTPAPVYLDPGMHFGLEVKGLNSIFLVTVYNFTSDQHLQAGPDSSFDSARPQNLDVCLQGSNPGKAECFASWLCIMYTLECSICSMA